MTQKAAVKPTEPIGDEEVLDYLKGLLGSMRRLTARPDLSLLHHILGLALHEVDAIQEADAVVERWRRTANEK